MTAFVDTGFFVALLVERDQFNARAMKALDPKVRMVTSSLVINETISLLQARGLLSLALEYLRGVRSDANLSIVQVDAGLQTKAWELFHRWGGIGVNAVDCTSFAVMQQFHIRRALTFDRHFREAGFEAVC